jgi:hypothetical protein
MASIASNSPAPTGSTARVKADFLFESVVCDLHMAALAAAGFTLLLSARAAGAQWSLRAWRSRLHDDVKSMQLTLRFHDEMGMPAATAARIAAVYGELARATAETPGEAELAAADKTALVRCAEQWRRLCAGFGATMEAIGPKGERRLPVSYDEDRLALAALLNEAARGDTHRVNGSGEVDLPKLRQRRSAPRASVRHTCALITPERRVGAMIEDVSRGGLGVRSRTPLRVGEEVMIELTGGRRLSGVVARVSGEQAGLRLSAPLAANDPLFGKSG